MSQSLASILVHVVFSTKGREPFIQPEIEGGLHGYMATLFKKSGSPSLLVGSAPDHVHALISLSRTETIADTIEYVKTESSKWVKRQGRDFRGFQWQSGYGAFSIGESNVSKLKRYIADQHEHHRVRTFQSEMRSLFRRYKVEFDERYVWD